MGSVIGLELVFEVGSVCFWGEKRLFWELLMVGFVC